MDDQFSRQETSFLPNLFSFLPKNEDGVQIFKNQAYFLGNWKLEEELSNEIESWEIYSRIFAPKNNRFLF